MVKDKNVAFANIEISDKLQPKDLKFIMTNFPPSRPVRWNCESN